MNAKNIFITLLLLLVSTMFVQAQKSKLQRANKEYEKYNYEVAIPMYLEVLDKIDAPEAKARLAEAYRRTNNWKEAEFWYGQIVNLPDAKTIYYLYYGMSLQANGKCDLAKEWFEEYARLEPDDVRGKLLSQACTKDEIETLINKCNSCYEIQTVPINTKYDDFAPTVFGNGLVFASERDEGGAVKRIHEWTGYPFLELFYTSVDTLDLANFEFTYEKKPKEFNRKLNTKFHDGPVSFSKDQKSIYITRNNYFERKRGKDDEGVTRLKIFIGKKEGKKKWGELTGLPFNSDEYSVAHPTVTDDGNKMYFASDMPGGFGGMDLYYTELDGGQWGPPINLGPRINTEGHEVFPYYHSATGKIYFSSNGQVGLGGLDIYSSKEIDGLWSAPSNIGAPMNSKWDDLGITLNDNETFGYFTSNREGGKGRDDIYSFRKKVVNVEILVFDELTTNPIPGSEVYIDCSKQTLITNSEGIIEIEMPIDKCCKFMASMETYRDNEMDACTEGYEPGGKMFVKIPLGRPLAFNLAGLIYDDSTRQPIADALVELLNDCDEPVRTVTTGLDGRYSFPDLDKSCCFDKIRVTKDELTDNNDMLYLSNTVKGVCTRGKTMSEDFEIDIPLSPIFVPFAGGGPNKKPGIPGNPDDNFPKGGDEFPKPGDIDYNPNDLSNPYNPNSPNYDPNYRRGDRVPIAFIIKHIYYDFDKSYIRDDAVGRLDTLHQILLDNPKYIVEIGSHTDARGSNRYNASLSKRRAKAVVKWLVGRGISRKRLTYKGYGENDPTNDCVDEVPCAEDKHQRNRRTEFRVVGTTDGVRFDTELQSTAPRYVKTDPCINCPF